MLYVISFVVTSEKKRESLHQFGKFALIGVVNTAIDFGVYYILTRYTAFFDVATSKKYIANVIAFIFAATCSFFANRMWTFNRTTSATVGEVTKFYSTTVMGLVLNSLLLALFIKVFALHDLVAKAVATVFVILWNFILQKLWVFTPAKNK